MDITLRTLHIGFIDFIQLRILFQLFSKFSWPFSACLGHYNNCKQGQLLTLFTIIYNEFLFRGLEKEKLSSWSGVLYCWACLELFVSMLFEENNWPSLCLLIFYSHLNEYYFLSRICNLIILCSEQCALLGQIYILSVFKWDWMTRNDNFS